MKKFDLSLFTLALLILAAVLLGMNTHAAETTSDETVAVINGESLTKDQFYAKLKERYGERMLERITTEMLIEQEAKKNGVTVSDEELTQKFAEYQEFLGHEKVKELIDSGKITEAELKQRLGQEMLINKLQEKLFTVSDEDLKQYFEKHRSEFKKATSYEQVKDEVRDRLLADKVSEWEDSLKEKAKIEILDPSLVEEKK